jgi:2-oxoglutarate ferredoxin oxidoreductase subunit delta
MAKIEVNSETCKGCTLCVAACPQKILRPSERINASGYHPIECFEPEKCKGCAFCAMMCPDVAITVFR